MSSDAILGARLSQRGRSRVVGVPNCGQIVGPSQAGRSSIPMPEAHEQMNRWVRDERGRLRARPEDERIVVVPGGQS